MSNKTIDLVERIAVIKAKIKELNADTARIDKQLQKEDHAADSTIDKRGNNL